MRVDLSLTQAVCICEGLSVCLFLFSVYVGLGLPMPHLPTESTVGSPSFFFSLPPSKLSPTFCGVAFGTAAWGLGSSAHTPPSRGLFWVSAPASRQDQALWGLQGVVFESLQRGDQDGGPLPLGAAGAAVAVPWEQAGQARDGVQVGLVGAQPGQGAELGQRGELGEPAGPCRKRERGEGRKRCRGEYNRLTFNEVSSVFLVDDDIVCLASIAA